jgi:hypothetical protein
MVPLLSPRALPDNGAQVALNANMKSGDLEAWMRPLLSKQLATLGSGPVETIFKLGADWLSFEQRVEVARGAILGDTTKRTYITGLEGLGPRWTNVELATTGSEPFPVETRPLGVPAPEVAPEVEVNPPAVVTGDVPVQNPGAEDGALDWTSPTGLTLEDHDNSSIPGFLAYAGTHYWFGGDNPSLEAYQDIDLSSNDITAGQTLALFWQQAANADGGKAGLALQFLDADDVEIPGTEVASEVMTITPILTWTERSIVATVPADAVSVRIMQTYVRDGGVELDAFVDAIRLDLQKYSLSWDGSSLTGWTVSSNGGPSENRSKFLTIDDTFGQPPPSFKFDMDSRVPFMYQNLKTDEAPAVTVVYDVYFKQRSEVSLFASSTGARIAFAMSIEEGTAIEYFSTWESAGDGITKETLDGDLKPSSTWLTVTLSAQIKSPTLARVTCTVVEKATGLILLPATTVDWTIDGGNLAFAAYATSRSRTCHYDNIRVQISPPVSDTDNVIVYTTYVYTFVNDIDEESAPSDPSETVQRNINSSVVVTMPTSVPTGLDDYHIEKKRLYRAVTGSTGTVFRFVAELDLATEEFVDNLPDEELGEVLETEGWDLPPFDLRNILALPNGIMVGSAGNQLCFSVSGHPHAWPITYRLPTDTDIVALGNVDTTVFLGTQSFVYTASGNSPDAYSMSKPGSPHSCTSRRSLGYLTGIGVVFAGPDGLMVSAGATRVENMTANIFTREQWQALDPTSILGVAHDETYYFFYDDGVTKGGYALEPGPTGFGLISLGMHACAVYADPIEDKLYLVLDEYEEPTDELLPEQTGVTPIEPDGTAIYIWNGDSVAMNYRWLGKLWLLPLEAAFQQAKVKAADYDALVLRLYRDGTLLMEKRITSKDGFTLPMVEAYDAFEMELIGTSRVRTVQAVEQVEEIR